VKFGLLRAWTTPACAPPAAHPAGAATAPTLTCTGTLMAGATGRIYVSGSLPANARPGRLYTLTARAVVAGTSQLPGTASKTVSATVAVRAAPPAPAGAGSPSALPSSRASSLFSCSAVACWSASPCADARSRGRAPPR